MYHNILDMESGKRRSTKESKESVETKDLIMLVRDRPCLWNRFSTVYRDREEKEKAWSEVYREIEPDFESFTEEMKNLIGLQITRKWYNIRDSYVKSKRSKSSNRLRPYIHSTLLGFLDPIHFEKNNMDSRSEVKSDNDDTEEQWLNEVFVVDDEGNMEPEGKRQKIDFETFKSKEDKLETDGNIFNVLADVISREDDEDRAFFRSILPAVKKLSDEAKLEFRIELMKSLKKLLNKDTGYISVKCEVVQESDTE